MAQSGAAGQEPIERVVLIGYRGQLGSALLARLGDQRNVLALDYPEIDMTRPAIIEQVCDHRPQVVINAAAWTDVDGAEEKQDACYAVNVLGVKHLAAACQRSGAALLHVSTNEVFPGQPGRFYREWDATGAQRSLTPAARRPPRRW
ncbi:MAG: sugar nucleotide-binding protein [Caldilineales bacterium]